jgi:hypothetical protein
MYECPHPSGCLGVFPANGQGIFFSASLHRLWFSWRYIIVISRYRIISVFFAFSLRELGSDAVDRGGRLYFLSKIRCRIQVLAAARSGMLPCPAVF